MLTFEFNLLCVSLASVPKACLFTDLFCQRWTEIEGDKFIHDVSLHWVMAADLPRWLCCFLFRGSRRLFWLCHERVLAKTNTDTVPVRQIKIKATEPSRTVPLKKIKNLCDLKPVGAVSNVRGQMHLKTSKGCHMICWWHGLIFYSKFRVMSRFEWSCITLQMDFSTTFVFMQMPTQSCEAILSCVFWTQQWLTVEVWEQHWGQRPCFVLRLLCFGRVWSVGAILRKVDITMMHWLTSELHRRFSDFHNAFKSASQYLKMWLWNIKWAGRGTVPATPADNRGCTGSGAGRHAGCFSLLCFTADVSGSASTFI